MFIILQNRFCELDYEHQFSIVSRFGYKTLQGNNGEVQLYEVKDAIIGLNKKDREECGYGFYLVLE